MENKDLAILILAAGSSSRLQEPKQLLKYKKKSLLYNISKKALSLKSEVFVVLGSNFEECKKELKGLEVQIIENKNYKKGLSSSIKEGIHSLFDYKKVMILLCDQPFIPQKHLEGLIKESNKNDEIICSFYNNDVAVPAIFPKRYFEKLLALRADKGAKAIIKNSTNKAVLLADDLAFDIDTKDDKKHLN